MLKLSSIDDHMDMVLPLLSDLHKGCRPSWSIDDALQACRRGEWMLFVEHGLPGFAMVSVATHRFRGHRMLCLEAGYMPNNTKGAAQYDEFWDALARKLGCSEIVMESKRRGFERRGWTGGWIQYSRPVKEADHV